jgi:pimeloyl-ACP methyl ester carboxylesterase
MATRREDAMTDHLRTNGIELAYDSFGATTAQAIVLISGLGAQLVRWTSPFYCELVNRGYRVIRFDNRDAGYSTHFSTREPLDLGALVAMVREGKRPDVPYALADMARDTVGLLDALSIERAHVVGRSMGGMIAQVLASEHPDRISSLTSIMSSTGNPGLPQAAPDVMAMMMAPVSHPDRDLDAFLQSKLVFARRIAGTGFPFEEDLHRTLVLEEARRAYDPPGFMRQLAAMALAGDRRPRLGTIRAPTLVIHGTEDPLIPPQCGEDTATSIPNAKFMLVRGMGHELPSPLYASVAAAIDQTAKSAIA